MADEASKIARLEQQQKEIAERIRREKAKLRREEREREKRRAEIAGALVLEHMKEAPEVKAWLDRLLEEELAETRDRVLFGLAPKEQPPAA